uniref:Ig-like domain-containing protein n=1 Tax=Mastacembelus armatus TaxID=205130 RepID=A0A3Q3LI49_9TELE
MSGVFLNFSRFLVLSIFTVTHTVMPMGSHKYISLCSSAPNSSEIRAVEWTRPGLDQEYVILYRDGRSDPKKQSPSFKERVELKDSQMKDGDVSVTLKNVTFNDTGTYECRVFQSQTNAGDNV